MNKDTEKAIKDTLEDVNKAFGKNALARLGDRKFPDTEFLPTGIPSVDEVLGCGGLPKGKIIEIYGLEGSGKSLMTLLFIASAQRQGVTAALLDYENSLDKKWAKSLGVDVDNLFYAQPDTGEAGFMMLEKMVEKDAIGLIVVDSIDAMLSQVEFETDMDESMRLASKAAMMGRGTRRLNKMMKEKKAIVIFINQLRDVPNVMYGNKTTTPGGKAMRYYACVRISVSRINDTEVKEKDGSVIGHKAKLKIDKSKVGPVCRSTTVLVKYPTATSKGGIEGTSNGNGIEKHGSPEQIKSGLDVKELIAFGVEKGVLQKVNNLQFKYGDRVYHRNEMREGSELIGILQSMLNSIGESK